MNNIFLDVIKYLLSIQISSCPVLVCFFFFFPEKFLNYYLNQDTNKGLYDSLVDMCLYIFLTMGFPYISVFSFGQSIN